MLIVGPDHDFYRRRVPLVEVTQSSSAVATLDAQCSVHTSCDACAQDARCGWCVSDATSGQCLASVGLLESGPLRSNAQCAAWSTVCVTPAQIGQFAQLGCGYNNNPDNVTVEALYNSFLSTGRRTRSEIVIQPFFSVPVMSLHLDAFRTANNEIG